jgi:hypothetical protein
METTENTSPESLEDLYKNTSKYFKENNYVILKDFIDTNMAGLIYQYALVKAQRTDFMTLYAKDDYRPAWDGRFGDEQAPISYNCYGDPFMDTILAASAKTVSNYTGVELVPTYSYWRLYQQGEVLARHRDRESCEISATLCVGYNTSNLDPNDNYNWPMYVEAEDTPDGVPIHLEPGDLILYKGCEVDHWREKFEGLNHVQVFLHYNEANGTYNNVLDGRPILGIPKIYQQKN